MSFIQATRQNIAELPTQTYAAGSTKYSFVLPKVGLLSRLFLTIAGTMTTTAGTGSVALSQFTGYNLIKRIRVLANSGSSIYDVSGYGTYVINRLSARQSVLTDSLFDATTDALVYAAPVAEGANTWKLGLEIPIALNDRDPVGLVMLQNNQTQIVVEIELNAAYSTNSEYAPVLVTGNATAAFSAGTIGLSMEYFTVPRDKNDLPAINVIHQYTEESLAISSAGVQNISLLRGNTYVQLIHYAVLAGTLNSAAIERLRILYNQSEVPYNVNNQVQMLLQRKRYGSDLPLGTFVHDWYMSNGMPNLGNSRDFINSSSVTEFQSELTIASGTTVTAGTSRIATIKRQLIQIA